MTIDRKRSATIEEPNTESKRTIPNTNTESVREPETEENLHFADPFGDDLMDEEIIEMENDDDIPEITQEEMKEMEAHREEMEEGKSVEKSVWRPGVDEIKSDEKLEYDASAYDVYHAMNADWPALSIDILRDDLGACRKRVRML